jgi:hypothetical protein
MDLVKRLASSLNVLIVGLLFWLGEQFLGELVLSEVPDDWRSFATKTLLNAIPLALVAFGSYRLGREFQSSQTPLSNFRRFLKVKIEQASEMASLAKALESDVDNRFGSNNESDISNQSRNLAELKVIRNRYMAWHRKVADVLANVLKKNEFFFIDALESNKLPSADVIYDSMFPLRTLERDIAVLKQLMQSIRPFDLKEGFDAEALAEYLEEP